MDKDIFEWWMRAGEIVIEYWKPYLRGDTTETPFCTTTEILTNLIEFWKPLELDEEKLGIRLVYGIITLERMRTTLMSTDQDLLNSVCKRFMHMTAEGKKAHHLKGQWTGEEKVLFFVLNNYFNLVEGVVLLFIFLNETSLRAILWGDERAQADLLNNLYRFNSPVTGNVEVSFLKYFEQEARVKQHLWKLPEGVITPGNVMLASKKALKAIYGYNVERNKPKFLDDSFDGWYKWLCKRAKDRVDEYLEKVRDDYYNL